MNGVEKNFSEMTEEEIYFMDQKLKQPFALEDITYLALFDQCYNPRIDEWIPQPQDLLFTDVDKAIIVPAVSKFYGLQNPYFDWFILSPKRCYNKPDVRMHTAKYLNYFEKFYDKDHELISIYAYIKRMIDFNRDYSKAIFFSDLKRLIIYNPSIRAKLDRMNEDNYMIPLKAKKGKSIPSLQYNTRHGKILMTMSLLMNMTIPLLTHFIYVNKIPNVDRTLLEVFDEILFISDVNIYSKLYETTTTEIRNNTKVHSGLWACQDIRGINPSLHSIKSIENIILNIMPKYTYDRNIISFNFSSIRNSTGYKITEIRYEYQYSSLSSSNRDEDFNSDTDKFEAYLIRASEQLYLQNKVNCEQTLIDLENRYGPYSEKEIQYYIEKLGEGGANIINWFQRDLIFNLMYKYFGDPVSINACNKVDYVKLMMTAKKILLSYNMVILPYIISGKVIRIPNKKNINKREQIQLESYPHWPKVVEKYRNTKILQWIYDQVAIILSSEFRIIDFEDGYLDGKVIDNIPASVIMEEFLIYVLLI